MVVPSGPVRPLPTPDLTATRGPLPTRAPDPPARPYALEVAILIDPPRAEAHGRRWSHLVSDTSLDELHRFARSVGIPERGFEGDHYDVPEERYAIGRGRGRQPDAGPRPAPGAAGERPADAEAARRQGRRPGARHPVRRRHDGRRRPDPVRAGGRRGPRLRGHGLRARRRWATSPSCYSVRRGEWGAPGGWREPGESCGRTPFARSARRPGSSSHPTHLRPRGYERFHRRSVGRALAEGRDLLQVFEVRVPGPRPTLDRRARRHLRPPLDDLGRARARVLRPVLVAAGRRGAQPARRVSSRARFSRADGSHSARAWAVR